MYPYLLQQGDLTIASYPFFYGLGVAAAGLVFALLLKKTVGLRTSANMFLGILLGILLGGRIMSLIIDGHKNPMPFVEFIKFESGGQVLYGSLLFAGLTIVLLVNVFNLPLNQIVTAASVAAPLGLAIGRVGCLLKGCCHGSVTSMPWGIMFPKMIDVNGEVVGSLAYLKHLDEGLITLTNQRSLPVHPVQLYEATAMIITFGILMMLWGKKTYRDVIPPVFLLAYAVVRFNIEFIRVHEAVLFGISIYQLFSIIMAGAGAFWLQREVRLLSRRSIIR